MVERTAQPWTRVAVQLLARVQIGTEQGDLVAVHVGGGQDPGRSPAQCAQPVTADEIRQVALGQNGAVESQFHQLRNAPPEHHDPSACDGQVGDPFERHMRHPVAPGTQRHEGRRARGHSRPARVSARVSSAASRPRAAVSISPAPGVSVSGRLTEQPSIRLPKLVLRRASRLVRS